MCPSKTSFHITDFPIKPGFSTSKRGSLPNCQWWVEYQAISEPEGETLQADWRRGQGPSAQTPGLGEHIQESLFQSLLHNVSGSAQAGGHPRTQKPRNHTALREEGVPGEGHLRHRTSEPHSPERKLQPAFVRCHEAETFGFFGKSVVSMVLCWANM